MYVHVKIKNKYIIILYIIINQIKTAVGKMMILNKSCIIINQIKTAVGKMMILNKSCIIINQIKTAVGKMMILNKSYISKFKKMSF